MRALAVDLRSGVRLLRLAELLTGAPGLVRAGHFPADHRPLQLQNVERALDALRAATAAAAAAAGARAALPLPEDTWTAADLVAGDRERTLAFLWHVFVSHQLPRLVDARTLRAEVARIESRARRTNPDSESKALISRPGPCPGGRAAGLVGEDHLALLLRWARAVCARGSVAVRSFGASFADGRALCLLVSFYLPWSLPAGRVYAAAAEPEGAPGWEEDSVALSTGGADLEGPHLERSAWHSVIAADVDHAAAARQREGIARNFALVDAAMARLGGVPPLVSAADCCEQGGPAEQVLYWCSVLDALVVLKGMKCICRLLKQGSRFSLGSCDWSLLVSLGVQAAANSVLRASAVLLAGVIPKLVVMTRAII